MIVDNYTSQNIRVTRKIAFRFSLIELLVVVSIIAILTTLLLPALHKAKETGRRITCLSNHKQYGLMFYSYAQDYNGWWVSGPGSYQAECADNWTYTMVTEKYAHRGNSDWDINLYCPSLSRNYTKRSQFNDYIMNGIYDSTDPTANPYGGGPGGAFPGQLGCKVAQITHPAKLTVLYDRWDHCDTVTNKRIIYNRSSHIPKLGATGNYVINPYSHSTGSNYLFADGHALWRHWKDIRWKDFKIRPEEMAGYDQEWNLRSTF